MPPTKPDISQVLMSRSVDSNVKRNARRNCEADCRLVVYGGDIRHCQNVMEWRARAFHQEDVKNI